MHTKAPRTALKTIYSYSKDICLDPMLSLNECHNLPQVLSMLNIPLQNRVVAFAEMGAWGGEHVKYRLLSPNIQSIFNVNRGFAHFFADRYDIRATIEEQGNSYSMLFRELTDSPKTRQFLKHIAYGRYPIRQDITLYTKSLRPYVATAYGW